MGQLVNALGNRGLDLPQPQGRYWFGPRSQVSGFWSPRPRPWKPGIRPRAAKGSGCLVGYFTIGPQKVYPKSSEKFQQF
ncbi:MAG: hypothetical protein A2600_05505 [Candidatus Lambdaproteobacteria bacterium RIFOXYD1_FULL_56_27]|uniref:Uncharacterized protein n=1 Tax=Candidatus Lambdaproteobacteria bacterium RIFOXYD2_FULL_56_26 TaxID=1817773 RepID=A0A1F6GR63_9PROT|nr:MAG: hypothetical protein A2557_03210 [Candidatus Lambdaproteobacteria bacterium RIFOXYD2_FULL_56_26]OGH07824.1 MAG: hypothetical protein A2600_05505 [Candidatus Lambdaproteobacteria bacterium RIFOXYD1_FULL_56_27]